MTYGPPRAWALGLLGGAALLALLGLTGDSGLRLLAWPAAALAVAAALRDLLAGPVLAADDRGLQVLDGLRRRTAQWSGVQRMRVVQDRRARLLEVDLGSALVLLSRSRLGRDPEEVLVELLVLSRR